jgi:hypothetical protein
MSCLSMFRILSHAFAGLRAAEGTRPTDGRIKAAACGESCCLRTVERSVTCHEVHSEPQPAFSKNARKDKARRTSHANTPRMAQKDRRHAASLPGHTPP